MEWLYEFNVASWATVAVLLVICLVGFYFLRDRDHQTGHPSK